MNPYPHPCANIATRRSHTGLVIAAVATVMLTTLSTPSEARDRSTSVTGPGGNTASRQVSRSQGNVSSSTTGFNGNTTSRQVTRTAAQTSATVTGADGQVITRSVERSAEATEAVIVGPNGQVITRHTTRQP